jgi:ribose 5-phosphate isomerase B
MSVKSVAIGSDHAGFELKEFIRETWKNAAQNIVFSDAGTYSSDSVDYPDYAHQVALKVEKGEAAAGILICGSGNGVCMAANKHQGIRAALCWTKELAELARQHNDANILCIPARFISKETALEMINAFLNTSFEGGRHANRVAKISC